MYINFVAQMGILFCTLSLRLQPFDILSKPKKSFENELGRENDPN